MRLTRFFRRDMTCQEMMEVLQSYLDGETDAAVARRVAGHLGACKNCDTESHVYKRIRESLASRQMEVDPQVLEALADFGRNLAKDGPAGN